VTDDRQTAADLTEAETAVAGEGGAGDRAFLVVYMNEGGGRTRVVELPDGVEVTFGRSRACTVMIDSEKVSRTHARVLRRGPGIVVEDLGSRNGTRVNGERVEAATRVSSGDEIGVGPVTAVVGLTTGMRRRTLVGGMVVAQTGPAVEFSVQWQRVGYERPSFSGYHGMVTPVMSTHD